MTDVRDFTPLYGSQTLAAVRARMDADANAGLQPDDPAWIDTREGTFYWDVTQVAALECARLWDALGSETVAAAFPSSAWGDYLDEHAATFGLVRNPAVPSSGEVTFIGDPNTPIAAGTEVSAPPTDPTADAITFATQESGTTSAQLAGPSGVTATPNAAGGQLPAGSYVYRVTAYNGFGETTTAPDVSVSVAGTTSRVALTWNAVAGATGYRVYRTLSVTARGQQIADVAVTNFTDTGAVLLAGLEPLANTTSGVTVPVTAMDEGSVGDLGALAISELETLVPGITLVLNSAPTTGGADAENDDQLQGRILSQYQGSGAGNVNWYVQQALAQPGIERAVSVPLWNGPGTVLVVGMLADGSPAAAASITALQQSLDPVAGQGRGLAPVGVAVTVRSTVPLNVAIAATIHLESGYTLDGAAGSIAVRDALTAALQAYLGSLNPADTIGYQQVQAALLSVQGVQSIGNLTVNGGVADITLGVNPAQYPVLTTPTFS